MWQKLEKGKPPEKVGRKVTDLSLRKWDRVAELPGNIRRSVQQSCHNIKIIKLRR